MALRLGTHTHTYLFKCSLEEAIQRLANLGFKCVEITASPPHIWPRTFGKEARKAIRELIESFGMELLGLNPTSLDLNMASTNPAIREETIIQTEELIELTKDLGGQVLVVAAGRVHPLVPPPYEASWELARESIATCVKYAEDRGIVLGLENVPGRFINTVKELKQMVREVESDYLKIVFDVSNAHMVEPTTEALEEVADYLAHIHLSDNDGKTWQHLPVGQGTIDFKAVAETLRRIGFDGIAIIEPGELEDPEQGFLDSISRLERFGWML